MRWEPSDAEQSIPDAFLQQVRQHPDKQAVDGDATAATFAEVEAESNRRAADLLERSGAGPGRTALLFDEGAPLLATILGAQKAGKVAVVLNPDDTPARLREILDDADPELVVTEDAHAGLASSAGVAGGKLMAIGPPEGRQDPGPPEVAVAPRDVAFLIYTSGSTGTPKGVIHTHRSFLHGLGRVSNSLEMSPDDRLPQLTSSAGFAGVTNLFMALLNGATLCPFSVATRGMAGLARWSVEQRLTILGGFPSVTRHVFLTLDGGEVPPVRLVVLGGEAVMPSDHEFCRRLFGPDCVVVHSFGSTETGQLAAYRVSGEVDPDAGPFPVGPPQHDWLDVWLETDGQIVVRSDYLTLGYWRDPEMTAARYSDGPDGRVFRTGDLGRLSPDGLLTVVGRTDLQVKVRGVRVSITKVEEAIAAVPGVTRAVVCPFPTAHGDTTLAAYMTTRPGATLTAAGVREELGGTLPRRELPTAFVFVDSLPFTRQGKIDREQLVKSHPPGPVRGDASPGTPSEIEAALAAIWAPAFGLERVGPHDDFFALGGDSLTAAVIGAGVHDDLGLQLDLRTIVDNPTIARMAEVIERMRSGDGNGARPALVRTPRDEPLPLSFAQERTWRTSQTPEESARYTVAAGIRLRGELDVEALRRSVDYLVRRHEMLRTTFAEHGGRAVQVVHPPAPVDLPLTDVSGAADPEGEASRLLDEVVGAPFDLREGPLFRMRLARTRPGEHVLLRAEHHIITDAWSGSVFFDELGTLYDAFRRGEQPPLPEEPSFQYADFAAWERSWLQPATSHYQAELSWWRETLRDAPPASPRLPFERDAPVADADRSEAVVYWGLEPEVTSGLEQLGREEAATYFMVRLALLAGQLGLETGRDDIVLGTYATGRQLPQTQSMFGWFSNLVTLRLRVDPERTFRELLAHVRARVVDTSAHTDFPYDELAGRLPDHGVPPPAIRLIFNPSNRRPPPIPGLEVEVMRRRYATMPWECSFAPDRGQESSECKTPFDARIHDPAGVREFIGRHQRLAAAVTDGPDRPLAETA
jgi:acyl-coenzyme A synthetase/AMP-(fatty) acid ligase